MNPKVKEAIRLDLDMNPMLNIFGLVNLSRVHDCVPGANEYTIEEVRQAICDLFDDSVTGGVQFKGEPRRHPVNC